MSGLYLLSKLRDRGIGLSVTERGTLRIESPDGMSPELRAWFKERKPELIAALSLEVRIHQMAARWKYTTEELTEALTGALSNPQSWLAWVEWDEKWTGGGSEPFKWH